MVDGVAARWLTRSELLSLLTARRRWKDNIKMDLQEVGCGGMDPAGSG